MGPFLDTKTELPTTALQPARIDLDCACTQSKIIS